MGTTDINDAAYLDDEEETGRICSHCGKRFFEGYILGEEYACSEECAIALYDGDREQFEADLLEEDENCGSTDCYWTTWY